MLGRLFAGQAGSLEGDSADRAPLLLRHLSAMKAGRVDPAARAAVAGPGLVWRELDAATQEFGLATTGRVVGSTGVAGLTLGGGIGYLDRLAGLTCDNLLAAEAVTADGQILWADAEQHPDLFWALRAHRPGRRWVDPAGNTWRAPYGYSGCAERRRRAGRPRLGEC